MVSRRDISSLDSLPDDFAAYAQVNPAYKGDLDPRVRAQIRALSVKKVPVMAVLGKRTENSEVVRDTSEIALNLLRFQTALKVKLAQINENAVWAERGPSTAEDFLRSPRTFLKTAQEVLCDPTDRIAFDRNDETVESLSGIVIDPRLVSNLLLENLGLSEFLPPKGMLLEEQTKFRANAIPKIREMLANIEAIRRPDQTQTEEEKLNYFRLMRIGEGENKGYVIGTQNVGNQKILFKSDIYSARRRIEHIRKGYEVEISVLMKIRDSLSDFRDALEDWKKPERREDLEGFRNGMMAFVDLLNFVRDDHKEELKRKIKECTTFEDSLGRRNPNVKENRLTGAIKDIGVRIKNISGISKELGADAVLAKTLIEEQIAPMKTFYDDVKKLHDRFTILHNGGTLSEAEKTKILNNLKGLKSKSGAMIFEPDMSFGQKFIEQIDKTIGGVESGDLQTAAKEFVKMYLIVKLKKTHMQLNSIYSQLSLNPESVEIESMIKRIELIRVELAKKDVAEGISTKEYDSAYGEVYHLLNSLKARLNELKNDTVGEKTIKIAQKILKKMQRLPSAPLFEGEEDVIKPEMKLAVFEIMKERLDGFSFEDLLDGMN